MTVVWVLILQFNSGPPGDGPPMTSVHEETEIVTKEYVSEEECLNTTPSRGFHDCADRTWPAVMVFLPACSSAGGDG